MGVGGAGDCRYEKQPLLGPARGPPHFGERGPHRLRLDPSPVQLHSATDISPAFAPSHFPSRGLVASSLDLHSSHLCFPYALSCQVHSPLPVPSPLLAGPSGFTLRPSPFTCIPLGNSSASGAQSPHFCLSPTFPFPWGNIYQPLLGLSERLRSCLPLTFQVFFFFPL